MVQCLPFSFPVLKSLMGNLAIFDKSQNYKHVCPLTHQLYFWRFTLQIYPAPALLKYQKCHHQVRLWLAFQWGARRPPEVCGYLSQVNNCQTLRFHSFLLWHWLSRSWLLTPFSNVASIFLLKKRVPPVSWWLLKLPGTKHTNEATKIVEARADHRKDTWEHITTEESVLERK